MAHKKLVAGNWKMNGIVPETSIMLERLRKETEGVRKVEVVVFPPFVDLYTAEESLHGSKIKLGAQNVFYEDEGAFTGEISPVMLKGLCDYVIVGHSERRLFLGESDKVVAKKVAAAIRNEITPIVCVGDTLQDLHDGFSKIAILNQLEAALHNLTADEVARIVIAYEPVWAISTSEKVKDCSASKAEGIIKDIKHTIGELFGKKTADRVRVIYGGSVNAKTANNYLEEEHVDGVLVGGASLDPHEFAAIIKGAERHVVSQSS